MVFLRSIFEPSSFKNVVGAPQLLNCPYSRMLLLFKEHMEKSTKSKRGQYARRENKSKRSQQNGQEKEKKRLTKCETANINIIQFLLSSLFVASMDWMNAIIATMDEAKPIMCRNEVYFGAIFSQSIVNLKIKNASINST